MPIVTLRHEIDCGEERFWKLFFDKDFNERLYRDALGFPYFEVVDTKETDTQITRRAKGQPKMNAPAAVQKVMGANFRYTEDGTYDKATGIFRWKMTPNTLDGKIKQDGSVRVEKLSDDKIRRITELIIEAKVFAVGGLIENMAEKQLREGWDASAKFMNQWVKDHPA